MVVAPTFGPLIGGLLDTEFGWESIFLFTALTTTAVVAWAVVTLPETRNWNSPDGAGEGFSEVEDWDDQLGDWSQLVRDACIEIARGDVRVNRFQAIEDARPLNLLTRFTELRNEW